MVEDDIYGNVLTRVGNPEGTGESFTRIDDNKLSEWSEIESSGAQESLLDSESDMGAFPVRWCCVGAQSAALGSGAATTVHGFSPTPVTRSGRTVMANHGSLSRPIPEMNATTPPISSRLV